MTLPRLPAPSRADIRRGILYSLAAVACFAVGNAMVKWLTVRYPVGEIAFVRNVFALIPIAVVVAMRGGVKALRTAQPLRHAVRAGMQFVSMLAIFVAFSMMPLADAVAITFAAPIFVTILSIPLLGERVGIYRWSAVIVGFLGVLLMVRPGPGVLQIGAFLALLNALLGALMSIELRRLSATESTATMIAWQGGLVTLMSATLLPFGWVTPSAADFGLLAMLGLSSGLGMFVWTQACRFGPAAINAPFGYTHMIWAMGFGFFIWHEVPTAALVAGSVVVAASGLFIAYRETVRRREAETAPAAPASRLAAAGDD